MERSIDFTIMGLSPLLTHNPASMERVGRPGRAGSEIPTPELEAERGLYTDENGAFCLPGIAIRNAFIGASSAWRGSWQKKKQTLKATVAHCVVTPELVPITVDGAPVAKYEIDTRRAVVQKNGVLRSRPKFPVWSASFSIVYDAEFLPIDHDELAALFVQVLNDAGNRIGVGDYRPQRSGWFGRFKVK